MSPGPSPMTSPDCDCRGLPFMPLEVTRLRDSDLVMLSSGDEFKAAVLLWSAAWLQVPAASLPDDDRILAKLSTYPLAEWSTLREQALRGWVKCSDGRLYHSVIADLASSAFLKRKGQAGKANSRWAKERARKAAESESAPIVEPEECHGIATAMQGTLEVKEKISVSNETSVGGADDPVKQAFDEWNELAARLALPKARTLDPARRKAIRVRLADGGMAAWREALAAVARSPHCRGENERHWRADLDFVCQAKSWRRLLEGFYGDDAPATVATAPLAEWTPDRWRAALEWFEESGRWGAAWGPKPTEPGCRAPKEILAALGYAPPEDGATVVPFRDWATKERAT